MPKIPLLSSLEIFNNVLYHTRCYICADAYVLKVIEKSNINMNFCGVHSARPRSSRFWVRIQELLLKVFRKSYNARESTGLAMVKTNALTTVFSLCS